LLGRWAAVGADRLSSMMMSGILIGAPLTAGVYLYMLHGTFKVNAVPPFAVLLVCPAVQVAYVFLGSLRAAGRHAAEDPTRKLESDQAAMESEVARDDWDEELHQADSTVHAATRHFGFSNVVEAAAVVVGFSVLPAAALTVWAAPAAWGCRYLSALTTLVGLGAAASICSLAIGRFAGITSERLGTSMVIGAAIGAILTGVVIWRLISGGQEYGSVFPMTTWLVYPIAQVATVLLSALTANRSR